MQIKTTMRYQLTPIKMTIIRKNTNSKFGKDVEKREPFHTVGGKINWYSHYGKQYGGSSKTKNKTTIWSSNSTPRYISKENKTLIWKDTCTPMFTAVLFTIAKTWKQPKCPSMDKEDVAYTHTYMHTHTHNGILFSHKKEWNFAICNNVVGSGGYYA